MKRFFTLYPENLDTSNSIPTPNEFLNENNLSLSSDSQDGPSEMVMHNLINYAKSVSVFKTKRSGIINVVLN